MKSFIIIIFISFTVNFSFSQEKVIKLHENETLTIYKKIESGKIENGIYICNKFNWKIKIPLGYTIIDSQSLDKLEQQGNLEVKKSVNVELQNSIQLIGFSLNKKNSFTSSFTPLNDLKKITLKEHKNMFAKNLNQILSTIKNAKFEVKIFDIQIGKYKFYRINVEGYNKNNNQLVFTQVYYNCLINKNLFSVLIGYTDKIEGQILEENFLTSLENW